MMQRFFANKYSVFPAILISAVLYFFSTGLQVNYWFLLWFAPVPVLLYSFFNSNKAAFWASFAAFTLSKANILLYFMRLLPPALAVMIIIITGLLFACAIVLNKIMITRLKAPVAVFVFPVLMTVFGLILNLFDGTFGDMASLGYTQVNNVYLLQIVSITGMYGITFILALFASLVTFLLLITDQKIGFKTFILPFLIFIAVFGFGILRLNHSGNFALIKSSQNQPRFRAVCLDVEHLSLGLNVNNPDNKDLLLQKYIELIEKYCTQPTDLVLFPEKITKLQPAEKSKYYNMFATLAYHEKCVIIVGWTLQGRFDKNMATVFFPDGKSTLEYQKKHLVKGWERTFSQGKHALTFDYKHCKLGVAICKDLDFPEWIRKYSSAAVLLVPAWDFQTDHWLHSRIAFLRGVENGFTLVRSAKEGDLTINDPYGRVVKEVVYTKNSSEQVLIAEFEPVKLDTFYSKYGDWFTWLNLIALFIMLLYLPWRFARTGSWKA